MCGLAALVLGVAVDCAAIPPPSECADAATPPHCDEPSPASAAPAPAEDLSAFEAGLRRRGPDGAAAASFALPGGGALQLLATLLQLRGGAPGDAALRHADGSVLCFNGASLRKRSRSAAAAEHVPTHLHMAHPQAKCLAEAWPCLQAARTAPRCCVRSLQLAGTCRRCCRRCAALGRSPISMRRRRRSGSDATSWAAAGALAAPWCLASLLVPCTPDLLPCPAPLQLAAAPPAAWAKRSAARVRGAPRATRLAAMGACPRMDCCCEAYCHLFDALC